MHRIAAADHLFRENPAYINDVEYAQSPAIFTGHLHPALLLAGSAGLLLAKQPQHLLNLLLGATAAEAGLPGLESADIILGEYIVQEIMTGPAGQVLRAQGLCQESEPQPVIFQHWRFLGHLL